MQDKKLAVIIPYRDRVHQLEIFLAEIKHYLSKTDIPFHIYVIEQDDAKLFNRGMLLNIGYKQAKRQGCHYMVFHDLDMLPVDVDYGYSEYPVHLATNFINDDRTIFQEYFGGVTIFPMEVFEKINGFSNHYWGWGYEDTDLLYRCKRNNIKLDTLKIKNTKANFQLLKLNGIDAYISGKNSFNFNRPITFHISFRPEDIICNYEKPKDEFVIFSIPGYDFQISYNSFARYNVSIYNKNLEVYYKNSEIKTNYFTTLTVTINPRTEKIKIYQDGELMGEFSNYGKMFPYEKEDEFFIGASKIDGKFENFFNGLFDKFIVYEKDLDEKDIKKLNNNQFDDIKYEVGLYYDTDNIVEYRLKNITKNKNFGKIFNCEIIQQETDEYKEIKIPCRRKSLFYSLKHEENGFLNNQWKDQNTRWNQMRFYNETLINKNLIYENGLSSLTFHKHGVVTDGVVSRYNVGL